MRLTGILIALALTLPAAWAQNPQAAKPAAKGVARGGDLPSDAEKVRDGVWKAKDKDGKTWFYSKTPFGYARGTEDPQAAVETAKTETLIRVAGIDGDMVRLERPTPFGGARWTKKIDELTDEEKEALERFKTKQTGKKE